MLITIYDSPMEDTIVSAITRIEAEMDRRSPAMAGHMRGWMSSLSGSAQPADYFLHPLAFPMLLVPWWVEETCCAVADLVLQSDLAYSTMNGYYAIRLIDNIMDGDVVVEPKLLPAVSFFHAQFQFAYQRHFSAEHPFWEDFHTIWQRSAEAAMQDASLPDIDRTLFMQVSAQKVCAARIPAAAVCYRYLRPDLLPAWFQLVDTLGCWHQMLNDLLDWRKDFSHHTQTYFLSEASRRRQPAESVSAWVVREGFAWGCQLVHAWMVELKEMAHDLQSARLLAYLATRAALFSEREAQIAADLQNVAQLIHVFERDQGKREVPL